MNAEQLKARQAPIKDRYRQDPPAAVVPLRSRGRLRPVDLVCQVDTPRGTIDAGLHPAAGGDGSGACSGDMLLDALVACAGVTLSAVATAMGISLRGGTITAEGEMDFRGTLGVNRDTPVGITGIQLHFALETDATPDQLAKLIQLTERYCVIFQTLRTPPSLSTSVTPSGHSPG